MYSMWIFYDTLCDAGGYAVIARFPNAAIPGSLQWLGQDRQIQQGYHESTLAYQARLIQWLDTWAHAGSSTGIMIAMLGYVAPLEPEILCVTSTGDGSISSWDTYLAQSDPFPPNAVTPTPPEHSIVQPANWQWDNNSQPYYYPWMYWRKWPIMFSTGSQAPWPAPTKEYAVGGGLDVTVVSDPVYGSKYENQTPGTTGPLTFNWGDGTCWGWAGTAEQSASFTLLGTIWKSAGCWIPWIIICYDDTWFQETSSPGFNMPNGYWGYYGQIIPDSVYGSKYASSRPVASTCTLITGTNDGFVGEVLGVG
jgi:hypothetical protein